MGGRHAIEIGTSVARYVVLAEVGRGGMGRVLRAYDPKLQREVALKEVRGEILGPEGAERLVVEARAMAKLSHPNVVAVYDVEELDRGRVVLVMEYIAGATLRHWLDAETRTWRDVVERFCAAAAGVAAAHAVGVLHRDFKASNVLVGDDGSVKVTDFGVAKLAGSDSSSSPIESAESNDDLTEDGVVLGTPRYMAPEQHRGESLTAAVDQYAFCVALWEALTTHAPFAGNDLLRQKTAGPPAWPDGIAPRAIGDAIRRGLAARPEDRWPSLRALTEALARDPAAGRKRWFIALACVGVGAVAFESWQSWAQSREQRCSGAAQRLVGVWDDERREAARESVLATAVPHAPRALEHATSELDRYGADWIAQHMEACEATTVRGEQSAAAMDLRIACLERARVQLDAVARVLGQADAEVVTNAHDLVAGLPPLDRCADTDALQAEVEPPLPHEAAAVDEVRALLAEAGAEKRAGRYPAARKKMDEAVQGLQTIAYGPVHAEVGGDDGMLHALFGDYGAAESALRAALEISMREHQWEQAQILASDLLFVVGVWMERPDEGLRYREVALSLAGTPRAEADVHSSIASILRAQGKYAEAEAEHRLALALAIEGDTGPLQLAPIRSNLGALLLTLGRNAEAETELREAMRLESDVLGLQHPEVATSMSNVAAAVNAQGRHPEAETLLRAALAGIEASLGPMHVNAASALTSLGIAQQAQGNYAGAAESYRQAIAIALKAVGEDFHLTTAARNNLGNALLSLGRLAEAESEHRKVLATRTKLLGLDHPEIATSQHNIARVLRARGALPEAEALFREALTRREQQLGPEHPEVALTRYGLAGVLDERGKSTEAEAELRAALAIVDEAEGADHPDLAMIKSALAEVLLDRGAVEEALAFAEQAWDRRQRDDTAPSERARAAFVLAQVLAAGDPDAQRRARARALAEQSRDEFRAAGEGYAQNATDVATWLEREP